MLLDKAFSFECNSISKKIYYSGYIILGGGGRNKQFYSLFFFVFSFVFFL